MTQEKKKMLHTRVSDKRAHKTAQRNVKLLSTYLKYLHMTIYYTKHTYRI